MENTTFQWLGAAGFRIRSEGGVILIDPFLTSRGDRARPVQPLRPAYMADADTIFVSHGHFDHIADVPAVLELSKARVYCSQVASDTLVSKGVSPARINVVSGGETCDMGHYSVKVIPSKHISFDADLVWHTVLRALRPSNIEALKLASGMPSGPVMVYQFDFGGLSVVHMGSLGMVPEDARRWGIYEPDILMPPLQGHTHICSRAAMLSAAIRPKAVVPQHQDDFFPPVSKRVEIMPFEAMVARLLPGCGYYEPVINKEFTVRDVMGGGA